MILLYNKFYKPFVNLEEEEPSIFRREHIYFPNTTNLAAISAFVGDGKESIIKIGDKNGGAISIPFGGLLSFLSVKNIEFDHLCLDINAPKNYRNLLQFRNCENISIKNCYFDNSNLENIDPSWTIHGIEARNITDFQVENNFINGCQLKLCGATGSAKKVLVKGNHFQYSSQMGVSIVTVPKENNPVEISDIKVLDNTFERIDDAPIYIGFDPGKGIPLSKVILNNILVQGNKISKLGYLYPRSFFGIIIRGTEYTDGISIINNEIELVNTGKYSYGILLRYAGTGASRMKNITIKYNTVSKSDHGGISVYHGENVEILENECYLTGRGIEVISSVSSNIRGNKVQDSSNGIRVINSVNVKVDRNKLINNKRGIFIEATEQEDEAKLVTSHNMITADSNKGFIGILSSGKGTFTEEHSANIIDKTLLTYRTREIPKSALRTVNGKRIN